MALEYKIYRAQVIGEESTFLFFVNTLRDISFQKQLANGEYLLNVLGLEETVADRNEAIRKTNWTEM